MDTTFSNKLSFAQSFPAKYVKNPAEQAKFPAHTSAVAINSLGYTYQSRPMDATYHLTSYLAHTSSTLILDFRGIDLEMTSNEAWGIDNVKISLVTAPMQTFMPLVRK